MKLLDKLASIDRRIIYLLIGIVVIIPLILNLRMPIRISQEVRSAYETLENLPPGSVVLASIDLAPGGTIEVTIEAGAEGNSMCIEGSTPDGLYAARHSLDAFQGGGAADAARMDAPALQLIVAGQMLGLYGCTLTAEATSETQFRVLVRCPRGG